MRDRELSSALLRTHTRSLLACKLVSSTATTTRNLAGYQAFHINPFVLHNFDDAQLPKSKLDSE